jgi:hypothetical protein
MMKGDTYIVARAHDYKMLETSEKGKEAINSSVPLQIKNTMGKTITCILEGAFKKAFLNPNVRAT